MPVISATWEEYIEESWSEAALGKKKKKQTMRTYLKNNISKRTAICLASVRP
jgi:hypothetical protein